MKRLFNISIVTSYIFAISGCQMEEDIVSAPDYHVISARFENSGTRTIFEEIPSSFNLTTKWQGHEYINVFYMMTDSYHETTPQVQVSEITEDGFGATFTYKVPEEWDKNDVYDVKLFTSTCFPKMMDGKVYYNASIIREPISSFQVPVYSEGEINAEGKLNATFHHYYTYELLHIHNISDSDIVFSLLGFNGTSWFKEKGSLCIDDGSFVVDAPSTKQPHRESNPITIRPGETQIIISAYIPNGGTIIEATMVALINGGYVYSSNVLSSGIELEQGHAYHMYASWDGTELRYTTASGEDLGSEVDAGGSGYGTDNTGNVSGTGLGFGTDGSGNIIGGGSGYGADGSGSITGNGSGYSNGN